MASNGLVALLRAVLSFLTVSLLVGYSGREQYGLIATITGMAGWLAVTQSGFAQSLRNDIIREPASAGRRFGEAFATLTLILGAIGLLLTIVVGLLPWNSILNHPGFGETGLLVASLWIVLLTALLSLVRAVYGAFQEEFRLAPLMAVGAAASFLLVLAGVSRDWGITATVAASLLPNLLGLCLGLFLMPQWLGLRWAWPRRRYRGGMWFFTIEVCSIAIFEADLFLVNLRLGQADAASFALHLQLFSYVEAAVLLFVSPWWSAFGDAWRVQDRAWLRSAVRRLAGTTGLLAGSGATLAIITGERAMRWLNHGLTHGLSDSKVIWNGQLGLLIGLNIVVQSVVGVYGTALGALGVAREPARIVLAQAVLNVCGCLWLIRRFGLIGAALGPLATYTLISGIYLPWKARQALR